MRTLSPTAAATRQSLLDAAERCFAERGFAGASTRQIAQVAGVSQPLLLHYFGSKRELFDAVLERAVASFEEAQAEQWTRPADDMEFFVRGLQVVFDWLGQRPSLTRLVAWARLEGSQLPGRWVEVHRRVAQRLADAQRAGVVRPELDADAALLVMDSALKGYWDRRADYVSAGLAAEHDLDVRYRLALLRLLLVGLLEPVHHERALAQVLAP